jgi:hypothetical protein
MTGSLRLTVASGIGALLFGGLLGLATVDGVRERTVPDAPIYPRAAPIADPDYAAAAPDCAGCTTYDEGYRWASARALDDADACFGEDWSRQRGCLAYVEGGRLH